MRIATEIAFVLYYALILSLSYRDKVLYYFSLQQLILHIYVTLVPTTIHRAIIWWMTIFSIIIIYSNTSLKLTDTRLFPRLINNIFTSVIVTFEESLIVLLIHRLSHCITLDIFILLNFEILNNNLFFLNDLLWHIWRFN